MKNILVLALTIICVMSVDFYDDRNTEVQKLTAKNWSSRLIKGRQNGEVFIVHFYKDNNKDDYSLTREIKEKAQELVGIVTFAAINCGKEASICKKEVGEHVPLIKVYHPFPIPPVDIKDVSVSKATDEAIKNISFSIQTLNEENFSRFIATDLSMPKVLYFSNDKNIPLEIKTLSNKFNKKMKFAFVSHTQKDIVSQYKVTKYPTVLVVKSGAKTPNKFNGEMKYSALFEFLNIFSEQFVPTDSASGVDDKPWRFAPVPEMNKKSAKEICLGLDKTFCVIYFHNGPLTETKLNELKELKKVVEGKSERSVSFKLMWIDINKHLKWNHELKIEKNQGDQIRVLNPGRRKRFTMIEGVVNKQSVSAALDKIINGDARFLNLPANLPEFADEL